MKYRTPVYVCICQLTRFNDKYKTTRIVLDCHGAEELWEKLSEVKKGLSHHTGWLVKIAFAEYRGGYLSGGRISEERRVWIGEIKYEELLSYVGQAGIDMFRDKFLFFGRPATEGFPRQEVLGDMFDTGGVSVWDWVKNKV